MLPNSFLPLSPLRLLAGFFIALACTLTLPSAHAQSDDDLLVVASIQPLEGLVTAVLGDKGRTTSLVSGTFSPHDMTLQPSHLRLLNEADVVVMIDPQFETFMHRALASLSPDKDIIEMAEVDGMTLHAYDTASHDDHKDGHDDHHADPDDHNDHDDHADHDDHKHGHDDDHEDGHDDHKHGHDDDHKDDHHGHTHASDIDLHIWLSPDNARLMLDEIALRLAKHAPAHKQFFQANAEAAKATITETETVIASRLAQATHGNAYLFFHDAFGYFTEHFNMAGGAVITYDPHLPLTASRMREVQASLADPSLACVFAEPQFALPAIPGISDLPIATLDPLGSSIAITTETTRQGLHYAGLLTALADSIIDCQK